jgi:replicative DNA helicase
MIEGHERTLLARFLVAEGAVEPFLNLRPEHFAVPMHREIFAAIVTLHYEGYSTCFPLVEDYLHARGKL